MAMAITIPDINQVLEDAGPAAAARLVLLLNRRRIIIACASGSWASCRNTSTPASPPPSTWSTSTWPRTTRCKRGETGWILESNHSMNRGMEAMGGRIIKRFRVYEQLLDGATPAPQG